MPDDHPILKPAPGRLVGERIVLRSFVDADADELHTAIRESVEHVRPWMPWYDKHGSVADTLAYIRRTQAEFLLREGFHMGIFSLAARFLGGCGLHARDWTIPAFEIGYWIRKSEEGKGYVSEATRLLTICAFETLGAQRVLIRCNARNRRSARVAERLGYVLEGTIRHAERDTSGNLADMLWFSLIPEEYQRVRATW